MWSMHDAAPVHSTHDIKQFLESHYPHWWWIGPFYPWHKAVVFGISLPTLMDRMKENCYMASSITWSRTCWLYLWGHLKGTVFLKIISM
jgi:hypothetical protein